MRPFPHYYLEKMQLKFSRVSPYKIYSLHKVFTLGTIMKYFFEIYHDNSYNECIRYSFGFVGYIQNLIQSILDRTEGADHCEFIFVDDG